MIVADTSGLLALLDKGEREHVRTRKAIQRWRGPLVTTDFVLAETDYLVLKRLGAPAETAFVAQLLQNALLREAVTESDLQRADEVRSRFADQELGLTDTTLMAVAERMGAPVLTLDRRHFDLFRDRRGRPLEILPR